MASVKRPPRSTGLSDFRSRRCTSPSPRLGFVVSLIRDGLFSLLFALDWGGIEAAAQGGIRWWSAPSIHRRSTAASQHIALDHHNRFPSRRAGHRRLRVRLQQPPHGSLSPRSASRLATSRTDPRELARQRHRRDPLAAACGDALRPVA